MVLPKSGTGSGSIDVSTLRKPATTLSTHSLLKKSTSTKMKIGVKLSSTDNNGSTTGTNEENFEEVEDTQKAALEADRKAKQTADDEALARRLQLELK
jgi:putative heme iron utilization protein